MMVKRMVFPAVFPRGNSVNIVQYADKDQDQDSSRDNNANENNKNPQKHKCYDVKAG